MGNGICILAQESEFGPGMWMLALIAAAAILFFGFVILLSKRYKRCPSNRVLVIYGKVGGGNTAKCVHGGAAFVFPIIQDYDFLSLEPMKIQIPLADALSAENIRVNVPSVFTVAIGTEPEVMQNAAIRCLGLSTDDIQHQAQDIIFGQLRQVIASMRIEEINKDREVFLHSIQHSLEPELRKIGLVLINVNITDITDSSGYIEAIGQKAASQAVQQARGDVAEQEKLGEVRVAEAKREKDIQVSLASKSREIGMREAMRDQLLKIADMDKEQKIGEQRAGYERDMQVKDSEQKMRISVARANASAIAGENSSQAEIAGSQATLLVKKAEAYQLAETRKAQAEGAVQEAQNLAQAKAALAQAERIEAERRAELEAPAKAQKARTIVEAEAEAEKRKLEAEGEAAAIYAKLAAEARGQYEILAKKGEGLKQIIDACGGAQQAFQMLMLEHLDTLAETAAKAISNIKFDKIVVWESGGGPAGTGNTQQFLQSMSRTLPPMMQIMKDIGGVELPDYLVKLQTDGHDPAIARNTKSAATTAATVEPAVNKPKA